MVEVVWLLKHEVPLRHRREAKDVSVYSLKVTADDQKEGKELQQLPWYLFLATTKDKNTTTTTTTTTTTITITTIKPLLLLQ